MTQSKNKQTILLILIAFTFSFVVRLIWVYQFSDYEQFQFNDAFMINTNDGYYYAEGARDILSGVSQENDLSPIESALSLTTAFLAKILPLSLETLIFYMPAFFASLIVIPLILIGRSIDKLDMGFIAALLASIAWSYYNRTMVGYYDTDMLNIVLPAFLLWSLIWALKTREEKYILFMALDVIVYRWWYPQSYSLEFAFFGLIAVYVIYQYIKKEDIRYEVTLLFFFLFAMMGLDTLVRLTIVIVLYIALKKGYLEKYLYYLLALSVLAFFATGGFTPIWSKLQGYVFKEEFSTTQDELKLYFFTVMQTIREASKIPFETFANRISGHTLTFLFAFVGYVWLAYKHRIMLLALPMLGLGFLAYVGGLRFTIYAVPILALGLAYLIVQLTSLYTNTVFKKYLFMSLFTLLALLPNIDHIVEYRVPTVFTKNEVEVLDKLKAVAQREDYVVGWWDYGYPIRYYADVKTLSDGGKHSGSVNFPTSFALTHPQQQSAKMLRLDVEYTEAKFAMDENDTDRNRSNIANMTLDYGFSDTNDFLSSLQLDTKLPEKTRDIYFFLPHRMMSIYPTVELFSNIDLMSGFKGSQSFLYVTSRFKEEASFINLDRGVKLHKENGFIEVGTQKIAIKEYIKTAYNEQGELQVQKNLVNPNGELYVVYMSNYPQFLVVDAKVYHSSYFQLFVLENYDSKYFEPEILTPLLKVYKLKI
jgi:undecaprenyl-diphosphooligosaccharide---protein glycotransferase